MFQTKTVNCTLSMQTVSKDESFTIEAKDDAIFFSKTKGKPRLQNGLFMEL